MNCKKCGAFIAEIDQFCKTCGAPRDYQNNSLGGLNDNLSSSSNMTSSNMNYPSMNNIQSNINQAPSMMKNNKNKSKIGMLIGIGVGALCLVSIFIFVISLVILPNIESKLNNEETNNGLAQVDNEKGYKISFEGYTFELPANYLYESRTSMLGLYDETDTWAAVMEIESGSFSQVKENRNKLPLAFQSNGLAATNVSLKTVDGIEFITIEVSKSGENALIAIAKVDSMAFSIFTLATEDGDYDYSLINKVTPILKSAVSNGNNSNSISANLNYDFSEILDEIE